MSTFNEMVSSLDKYTQGTEVELAMSRVWAVVEAVKIGAMHINTDLIVSIAQLHSLDESETDELIKWYYCCMSGEVRDITLVKEFVKDNIITIQ